LRARYSRALAQHCLEGDEGSLGEAYELGQAAFGGGLVTADLLRVHHEAMRDVLPQLGAEGLARLDRASTVLSELLAPLDRELLSLKHYQDQERRLNENLRKQAASLERTNEELAAAKVAAESSTRAKAEFLANMSHEIRTPMNAVIGMTSLLIDSGLTKQQRDYVETLRSSGEHLLAIINDILDFSKLESGKLEPEMNPFSVRDAVEDAVDLFAVEAASKGVELAYLVSDDVPAGVVSDLARLRQVLLNLVNNALKFTRQGEVVLSVDSAPVSEEPAPGKVDLHFSVRDTGAGIPPDRLTRLFKAFSQADASTTRTYGGTGLGLAISSNLARVLGGKMWVESTLGQGSTFHFTIRAAVSNTVPHGRGLEKAPQLEGKRVLIVDDNATNLQIASHYTRAWGMRPIEANSPGVALELFRRGDVFDIALLDFHMPTMDGIQLAAQIRRLAPKEMPLLMLHSGAGRRSDAEAAGVHINGFLTKPIKPGSLRDAVLSALVPVANKEEKAPVRAPVFDEALGARHPLRVLVAEDNAINQRVIGTMLGRLGYKPEFANNGREAVEAAARSAYDVIFMDVQMPVLDGYGATQELRRSYGNQPRPRIIAMTANVSDEDRKKCSAAGMDDYIPKPIIPQELMEMLRRCEGQPDLQTALQAAAGQGPRTAAPASYSPDQKVDFLAGWPFERGAAERLLQSHGGDAAALAEQLRHLPPTIARLTTNLRSAADRGQQASGKTALVSLRSALEVIGAQQSIIDLFREVESMDSQRFLRDAVTKVAQIQVGIEGCLVSLSRFSQDLQVRAGARLS
jgi:signal transduction histidine kinase/DNA-binding response OmpR family regulator